MEENKILWKRVHHGNINEPLIDYLEKLVEEQFELGNSVKICVGTDSQKRGKGYKYALLLFLR